MSIAEAIIRMLANVPKPGFSFSGIHKARTRALTTNVDSPTDSGVRIEIP